MGWLATSVHRGALAYNKTALRFIKKDWPKVLEAIEDISFAELDRQSHLFSLALKKLGLKKGECIFALSPRLPALYIAAIGSLKRGTVFSPLFSAFGPEPIQTRISKGSGRVLFSLASLYKRKIEPIRSQLPSLEFLILIDDSGELKNIPGAIDFHDLLKRTSADLNPDWIRDDQNFTMFNDFVEPTDQETPALLHFTSGTTGQPKGAVHVHGAAIYHLYSGQMALDLKPSDIFWCTADPGWVTGMSYGILSPLFNGVTALIDEAEFQADRWYRILQEFDVNVWYTAPTALRMLMKQGDALPTYFNLNKIRFVASVGEPLNPEVILWARRVLRINVHDNWWQTETGGIMIANFLKTKVRPGSMGHPLPGIEVRLVRTTPEGNLTFVTNPNEEGEIALRKGWPAMFRGYLNNPERYDKCFKGDWYLSGDLATFDEDGYYWFIGRTDDVIKSSGHLIGPFEVENAIMEHPLVAEAGVIGKPDPVAGEIIKAFVALKENAVPSEDLRMEILGLARVKLGPAVAPKDIAFVSGLPKTRSGKIMRRLLKARELGLPEGDTSTLEPNP